MANPMRVENEHLANRKSKKLCEKYNCSFSGNTSLVIISCVMESTCLVLVKI